MKKTLALIALLALVSMPAMAQTNGLFTGIEQTANALVGVTNWNFATGYGRATTGNRNLAFTDILYNISENVGFVVGGDYLWSKNNGQFNTLKGGVTLQVPVHLFAFLGSTFLTNAVATPFGSELIAQPSGNTVGVGNIVLGGMKMDLATVSNFKLSLGAFYESRVGQGKWDASYPAGFAIVSRAF